MLRIGIDVGGTFTDLVAVDDAARVDARQGRLDAGRPVDRGDGRARAGWPTALGLDLRRAARARPSASSTARRSPPTRCSSARAREVGLLTTEGHRDIIEMREGLKDDRYNLRMPPPEPAGAARSAASACASACAPTAASRRRSTAPRSRRRIDSSTRAGRRGGRRSATCTPIAIRRHERATAPRLVRAPARRLRLALVRGAAADQGVRARLYHGGQRLRRPGAGALPDPPRRAAARRRVTRGES